MLRSSLYNYSDAYIFVEGTIIAINTVTWDQTNNCAKKKTTFKNYALFINCISRINNTEIDDAYDIDVVMSISNLIEYSDHYSKTSGILWQYCRGETDLNDDGTISDFTQENKITDLFKIKATN